jgi:hypothetical protein
MQQVCQQLCLASPVLAGEFPVKDGGTRRRSQVYATIARLQLRLEFFALNLHCSTTTDSGPSTNCYDKLIMKSPTISLL